MNIVKILDNVIEQQDYVTHETELNVADFLATIYEEFPRDARIYHEKVCGENDVTPYDANSIEGLKTLKGTFYVVTLPKAPVLAFIQAYGAYIAMAVAIVAAVVMSRQAAKIPNAAAAVIMSYPIAQTKPVCGSVFLIFMVTLFQFLTYWRSRTRFMKTILNANIP